MFSRAAMPPSTFQDQLGHCQILADREDVMTAALRAMAVAAIGAFVAAPSWAQQSPAPAAGAAPGSGASTPMPIHQPPPTTVPGRPDIPNAEVNAKLRGVAPPPLPTPEDKLPVAQLKLPKGFKIEVYASGIPNARSLRLGDKGTVFVSNRLLDKVYAVVDRG